MRTLSTFIVSNFLWRMQNSRYYVEVSHARKRGTDRSCMHGMLAQLADPDTGEQRWGLRPLGYGLNTLAGKLLS